MIFFSEFFLYTWKPCCLKSLHCKNLFNHAGIFVLRPFKIVTNQTENFRLEVESVSKFWCLRNANHMKFTKECRMYIEKHIKRIFTNWLNMGFPLWGWVIKKVHVEMHQLSSKGKDLGTAVSKEGSSYIILDYERICCDLFININKPDY